jgi:superfamily II DNA/RNA helicase
LWTLMFSATWGSSMHELASRLLSPGAVHVTIGSMELAASTSVTQRFEIMRGKGAPRMRRLCTLLREYLSLEEQDDDADGVDEDQSDEDGAHELDTAVAAERGADETLDERAALAEADAAIGGDTPDGVAPIPSVADALSLTAPSPCGDTMASRVVVFVLYKQEARAVAKLLVARGFPAAPIQGDMSQTARAATMQQFRAGKVRVLVATDVAARGLDVAGVSHVINFSLGLSLDMYVHRCGRCGRAGASGVAHSFVVDGDEALVPPLVELLERSRRPVPINLKELSLDLIRHAARDEEAARKRGGGGTAQGGSDDDSEDDVQAQRMANRQKQKDAQQKRMQKEKAQQKKRGPTKMK